MKNPRMVVATASACPVCGQRLSSSDPVCSECGAILALRMTHERRPTTVKSRFTAIVHRRFIEVSAFFRNRLGFYIIMAVLVTVLGVAMAGVFAARPPVETVPRADRPEAKPQAGDGGQRQVERQVDTAPPTGTVTTHGTRSPRGGWTIVGMFAAAALGALLWALSATLARRRRHDRAAGTPASIASGRIIQAASGGAAFCFGLAVALAVVLTMESRVAQPTAALATVERERHETSTLSERLSVLDARLASLESRRAGERTAREQPGPARAARSVDTVAEPESSASLGPAVPTHDEASTPISTADILRSPRVATATLGDRVWDDIVRDWERLTRSVRELFARDAR